MTKIRGRVAGVDAADLTGITVKIWRSSNRAGGFLHPSSVDSTGAFEIHLRDGTKGVIRAVCPDGRYLPSDDHEFGVRRGEVYESIPLVLRKR